MKKTMKKSLLLVIVIALFATITLTASATDAYNIDTSVDETTCTSIEGHVKNEVPSLKPATVETDGEYTYACVHCNAIMESVVIPQIEPESVILSAPVYVYNGKTITPSLKIKDIAGNLLVEDQDYKVTYASGRKNPGKYTVTITFTGNYEGTSELAFTILPKAVSNLKSTDQTTNSITLSWSKVTGATGYRIYQYNSSTKNYDKIKTVTSNSYKVTGLKENTTYKFKVRAYTKLADGTAIFGGYSSVNSAKTKIAYSVKFSGSSATIYVGATKQLKATTTPADKKLTWKSSNTSIAKVSSTGKVTAVKSGTVTITASFKYKDNTYKGTYKIIVKTPSVSLNKTSATITKGNTLKLTATTAPADLTVTWTSSNTSVATVSSSGKITAKKAGTATITASITYKGKTYKKTCKVTVKNVASASGNITKLINHINKNGSTNSDGNKYIKSLDKSSSGAVSYTYAITYDKKNDCLEFLLIVKATYELQSFTAILDRSGTYVNFEFSSFDLDYYGDVKYAANAVGSLKASAYKDEYDAYEGWNYNYYPSSMRSDIIDEAYAGTGLAMLKWDNMVYDAIGLWLKDLGFTNYKY